MIYIHVYETVKNPKEFSKQVLLDNLSHYLGIKGSDLKIQRNVNGKPSVEGIHFSISHCQNKVVQVFTKLEVIGVDIEHINPKRKYLELARRYFHSKEYDYLASLEQQASVHMFYQLWTAKEAICKAQGGRLWYYLEDNYLTYKNTLVKHIKQLEIKNFNIIEGYKLSIATSKGLDKTKFIYA